MKISKMDSFYKHYKKIHELHAINILEKLIQMIKQNIIDLKQCCEVDDLLFHFINLDSPLFCSVTNYLINDHGVLNNAS